MDKHCKIFYIITLLLVAAMVILQPMVSLQSGDGGQSNTETTEPAEAPVNDANEPFAMEKIAFKYPFTYYRETVTDVIYLKMGDGGNLTPVLDPETSLPLTYTRYMEMYGQLIPPSSENESTVPAE